MQSRIRFLRITALVMLMAYIQTMVCPVWSYAQIPGCQYDSNAPSLDNARKNFKSLNYKCAEAELNDLLKNESLTLEEKSNAHILMAAVYYAMLKDDSEKRSIVMDQFKAAFQAYRNWKGELDIKSPEFMEMMKEAQNQVDSAKGLSEEPQAKKAEDTTAVMAGGSTEPAATSSMKAGKPWYKQWWAIGLGVGVVAGAVVVLAGGGGGGETTTTDTLPSFPPPPVGK